jgi:hypothetical protein
MLLLVGALPLTAPTALMGADSPAVRNAATKNAPRQTAAKASAEDIYTLQHKVMPGILFSDKGALMFNDLSTGNSGPFLQMVQEPLGAEYASGIKFAHERHPDFDIVLVSFPAPYTEPGCFHAALVKSGNTFRYVTLESGGDLKGVKSISYLCEWTPEFKHRNYGARNYDDLSSFRAELLAFLKKPVTNDQ